MVDGTDMRRIPATIAFLVAAAAEAVWLVMLVWMASR